MSSPQGLLRARDSETGARVTNVELFFDLVFAFAVTQLSHTLLHHLDGTGAAQTGLLMLSVWWVWVCTAWVTNWLDPEVSAVRLLLFVLMLAGLVLSASLPEAFGRTGLTFALTYVFMQVGRSLFMVSALRGVSPGNHRNFLRITAWLCLSAVFWICGGLSEAAPRVTFWSMALLLEYASASFGFYIPGLGRSSTSDWTIAGGHLAERCSQFVLIALGESILVTGSTAAELPAAAATVTAFLAAFLGSVGMWWIYFNIGAVRSSHLIERSADPGRLGRWAYTYVHVTIVAGIVVCAVADEIAISHPGDRPAAFVRVVFLGGPALYLIGNLLFKRASASNLPLSHLVGLALLGFVLAIPGRTALQMNLITTGVLLIVALWESASWRNNPDPWGHRGTA